MGRKNRIMLNEKTKVAIVIPTYNVEQYVYRAIESAIDQTHQEIEIIIIDDGSTDKTWEVIQTYKEKDQRIKCFRQKNSGVSIARNMGLKEVTSDFVLFLDSDDWLEKDAIEILLRCYERFPNYLICADCFYVYMNSNGIYREKSVDYDESVILEKVKALSYIVKTEYKLRSSCYKLFIMKAIRENGLNFDEKIRHGEDGLFVFQYLHYVKGLVYSTTPLWNILERPGSATTSEYNQYWITAIDAVKKMMNFDNSIELQNKLKIYLIERALMVESAALKAKNRNIEDIKYIRKIIREEKAHYLKKTTLKNKVFYVGMVYSPIFILEIYFKKIRRK